MVGTSSCLGRFARSSLSSLVRLPLKAARSFRAAMAVVTLLLGLGGAALSGLATATPAGAITPGVISTLIGGNIPEANFWLGAGPDGNMWYANPIYGLVAVSPSANYTDYPNDFDDGTCGTGCTDVAGPEDPTAGPFGDLYFVNVETNGPYTVAWLDPSTGAVDNFEVGPSQGNDCTSDGYECQYLVGNLTRGPGNTLWFETGSEQIGELTFTQSCTSGNDVAGPVCTVNQPTLTWYDNLFAGETESTEGQAFACEQEYGYDYLAALGEGPDGDMWVEDLYNMSLLRIDPNAPAGSQYTDYSLPAGTVPYGPDLQAGPNGLLWFYNYNYYPTDQCDSPETPGQVGKPGYDSFNPATDALTAYTPTSVPDYEYPEETISSADFAIGPDGNLWYTYQPYEYVEPGEPEASNPAGVGELIPGTDTFNQYPDPARGTGGDYNPSAIAAGPNGEMWFLPGIDDCEGCGDGADNAIQEISTSVDTGTVNAVSPAYGPDTGGATVWITGTGFTGATQVDFGGVAAQNFTVVDDTTIEATTPSEPDGTVVVSVTTPAGTTAAASDQYTFVPPVVQSAPTTGSVYAGTAYSGQLATTGNTGAVTYTTTSGTSPVTVSATGAVSAPDTVAVGSYTVSGTDVDTTGNSGTWTFTLTVKANTITVTPASASVSTDAGYSGQLVAHGNATTATFSQSGASSPPGVTVSTSGAVSAPTSLSAGTYTVSGSVGDSLGDTGSWTFTLTVVAGTLTFYPTEAVVPYGGSYNGQLYATGSHGTVTYSQSGSSDVSVSSSGAISAPALPAGSYTASGSGEDSLGDQGPWNFLLYVYMVQEAPTSAAVDTGSGYSGQLTMAGGTGTLTYDQTYQSSNPGVTVSSSGAISAPTTLAAGTYYASGSVTDSLDNVSYWSFSLTVEPQAITQEAPFSGSVDAGTPFSGQLAATPSAATVTYYQEEGSPDITVSSSGAVTSTGSLAPGVYNASGYDTDSLGDDIGAWSFQLTVNASVPGGTLDLHKMTGLIGNYPDKVSGTGWNANGDTSVTIYECATDTYSPQCTSSLASTAVATSPHSKAGDISVTVPVDAGVIDTDGDTCGVSGSGTCYLVAVGSSDDFTASSALGFSVPQISVAKTTNVLGNSVDKVTAKYFPIGDTVEALECNDAANTANMSSECDTAGTISGTAGPTGTVAFSPNGVTMLVGSAYADGASDDCNPGSTCVMAVNDLTDPVINFQQVVNFASPAVTVSPTTVANGVGKTIKVTAKDFPVGDDVIALECDSGLPGGSVGDNCDTATMISGTVAPSGTVSFSSKITVVTGTAYSDGVGGSCLPGGPSCYVAVYDVSNPDIPTATPSFKVS